MEFVHCFSREIEGFVPSIMMRYRHHILFPVLRLCLAMLTALGIDHRQASRQVLRIVVAHADVFHAIMRGPRDGAYLQLESLQELALASGVISRAAIDGMWYSPPILPSVLRNLSVFCRYSG